MTSEQARLIRFALKFPGWHTYAASMGRTVNTLAGCNGILQVNKETKQFRLNLSDENYAKLQGADNEN